MRNNMTPLVDVFITLTGASMILLAFLGPAVSTGVNKVEFRNEKEKVSKGHSISSEKYLQVLLTAAGGISVGEKEGQKVNSVKGLGEMIRKINPPGVCIVTDSALSCEKLFTVMEVISELKIEKVEFRVK